MMYGIAILDENGKVDFIQSLLHESLEDAQVLVDDLNRHREKVQFALVSVQQVGEFVSTG